MILLDPRSTATYTQLTGRQDEGAGRAQPEGGRNMRTSAAQTVDPIINSELLLERLNPEQAEVARHSEGPILVAAAAGTGKTETLVRRVAHLVAVCGVRPDAILAVTFSVKAAKEMNDRLARYLGKSTAARIGTFHSLALQIIREEKYDMKQWEVDSADRYEIVVKDVLGFRGMDWKDADLTQVKQFIGRCKAWCALPGSAEARKIAEDLHAKRGGTQTDPESLCEAYQRAEVERIDRRLITFDDMLLEAWHLLATDESVRRRWAARWSHVLQDEAQDENRVQHELAALLARDHRNYMVVGDPAQSIYGFRGADPKGLIDFPKVWEGARIVKMGRNYRCGDAIVRCANGVMKAMAEGTHLGVEIIGERGEAGSVRTQAYADLDAEGEGVVLEIMAMREDGDRKWSDFVVLYRTNAQSRGAEEACLANRIPYVVIGGTNFYERKEVKDVLAYLRLAAGRGSFDDVRRCVNAPFRYLGKAFLERVERASERARGGVSDWPALVEEVAKEEGLQSRQRQSVAAWARTLRGLRDLILRGREAARAAKRDGQEGAAVGHEDVEQAKPAKILRGLLMDTGYVQWLTRDEGSESVENNRVSNVNELVRSSQRFPTCDELLDYVDEVLREARAAKREGGEGNRVTLTSLHRSKGLEWPVVFMIGCNEGILPHKRAEDVEEERRLFYVGTTRARDELVYSYVGRAVVGAKVLPLSASRFLTEAGVETPEAPDPEDDPEPVVVDEDQDDEN